MSGEPQDAGDAPDGAADLFSNLPRTRPGSRSEARDRSQARRARTGERPLKVDPPVVAKADADAAMPPKPQRAPQQASPAPAAADEADPRGSVEGLAWAGVTAAAEAATLGVKLATRAMSAVRGAVERK